MTREKVLLEIQEIECRIKLPKVDKIIDDKDIAIIQLENIIFNLLNELDSYKTTIELYQPYFKGVDMIKSIDKMQEGDEM